MNTNIYEYYYKYTKFSNDLKFGICTYECESKKRKNSDHIIYKCNMCAFKQKFSESDLDVIITFSIDSFKMYSLSPNKIEYFMNEVVNSINEIRNNMIETKMKEIESLKNNEPFLKSMNKVKLTLEEIKNLTAYDTIYAYDIDENGNEYNENILVIETRDWSDHINNPDILHMNNVNASQYNQINKDIKDYNKTWTAYKYVPIIENKKRS